jgi:hypothetical protein
MSYNVNCGRNLQIDKQRAEVIVNQLCDLLLQSVLHGWE